MAKYIFKVKKVSASRAEIIDAKAYDVSTDTLTSVDFGDFYDEWPIDIMLKKNESSGHDFPWTQHKPHFGHTLLDDKDTAWKSIENHSSSNDLAPVHYARLNRTSSSAPLYIDLAAPTTATFSAAFLAAPRYIAYCQSNAGQGSPKDGNTGALHVQIIQSAVTSTGSATESEWTYHPDNNLVKGVYEINTGEANIRAGYWLKDENNSVSSAATTRARQILAVVKVGFNNGTNKYTYRLYIDNTGASSTQLLMNPTTSSGKLGVYGPNPTDHGFNSSNAIVLVDHGDVTHRQPGVPDLGSTFYSAHIFRSVEMSTVNPVVDDGTSGKPSIVGTLSLIHI